MNKKVIVIALLIVVSIALLLTFIGINRKNELPEETEPAHGIVVGESDEEGIGETPTMEMVADDDQELEVEDVTEEDTQATESTEEEENTEETEAEENVTQETKPEDTQETKPTEPPVKLPTGYCCEYASYIAMSPAKQQAYMEKFSSVVDFIAWCQKAQLNHESHNQSNEGDGEIDIGDYMGNK